MPKNRTPTLRPPHPGDESRTGRLPPGFILGGDICFQEHTCNECGVKFAIEYIYDRMIRRGGIDDDGEYEPHGFHCPNGHELEFPEPPGEKGTPKAQLERTTRKLKHDNNKLRREVVQLKHDLEVAEADTTKAREEAELVYAVARQFCPDKTVLTAELAKRRKRAAVHAAVSLVGSTLDAVSTDPTTASKPPGRKNRKRNDEGT